MKKPPEGGYGASWLPVAESTRAKDVRSNCRHTQRSHAKGIYPLLFSDNDSQ